MKKEILLYPTISANEVLMQFTSDILLDKNLVVNVPSDYTAYVFINQKLTARIEACNDTNLLKYLGKNYNGSLLKIAFLRKTDIPAISWGFGEINVRNAKLEEAYRVGANGKYIIKINDVSKFIKAMGTDENITLETIGIKTKPLITTIGKPLLSQYFSDTLISAFEINSLSGDLREKMLDAFEKESAFIDCGLQISDITINGIHIDEDDMELIRNKINKSDSNTNFDSNQLENIKKEIIEFLKENKNDDAMVEIQNLKNQLAIIAENQTTDTVLDEIDNLRTDLTSALNQIRKPINDSRIDSILKEIDDIKRQYKNSVSISSDEYVKQTKELLNEVERRLSNKIDNDLSAIKLILENSADENEQKKIPLYDSAKEEWLKNLKLTTDLQLEKAENDDDFACVAGLICSNVENNLMSKHGLAHKERDFYMTEEEFNSMSSSVKIDGKSIFKDTYKPRYISFKDMPGDYVEMPLEFRFIKAGLKAKDALNAARDWTVLNKFRHRSDENIQKLKIILSDRKMNKKQFLKYVLTSYRELKLYTRD